MAKTNIDLTNKVVEVSIEDVSLDDIDMGTDVLAIEAVKKAREDAYKALGWSPGMEGMLDHLLIRRTAGDIIPEPFNAMLDDREAIKLANPYPA